MMRNLIHLQKSLLINMQQAVLGSKTIIALSFLLHLVRVQNGSQPLTARREQRNDARGRKPRRCALFNLT